MQKKTLPALRISEDLYNQMLMAIKKYNDRHYLAELNLQSFRRKSYEVLVQFILKGKFQLPFFVDE